MGKEFISIAVFVLLCLISAFSFHYVLKNFLISSILSALAASLLFQVIGFFVLGYLDPFFLIAFTFSLVISFPISILIGILFVYHRKKANKNKRTMKIMSGE